MEEDTYTTTAAVSFAAGGESAAATAAVGNAKQQKRPAAGGAPRDRKKKKKQSPSRRAILVFPDNDGGNATGKNFTIDGEDHKVMKQIVRHCHMQTNGNRSINDVEIDRIRDFIDIREGDEERRVNTLYLLDDVEIAPPSIARLDMLAVLHLNHTTEIPPWIGNLKNLREIYHRGSKSLRSVPDEIGNATNLQKISIPSSSISSIPASIGNLKNLRELCLDFGSEGFKSLPDEIGNLTNLQELCPPKSISALPASIGNLKNLLKLQLSHTNGLKSLPVEIGNATNLQKLYLTGSGILSLPTSIGNLKNLRELFLTFCDLQSLPVEIGDATNLQILRLDYTRLSSIPVSIGNLKNLEELELNYTYSLKTLPAEVGHATNLRKLNLGHLKISSLPGSVGNLKNLRQLKVHSTPIPTPPLLDIARQCPLLGCFGLRWVEPAYENLVKEQLSLNRARSRVVFRNDAVSFPPSLWSLVLEKPERASGEYSFAFGKCSLPCCFDIHDDYDDISDDGAYCGNRLAPSDAVFRLLVERGAKDIFFENN